MFIDNKYKKWYYCIINNAKKRGHTKIRYTEKHHIIPKSLGGNNDEDNLVHLTFREHIICHMLLVRFVEKQFKHKMTHALWCMYIFNGVKLNSKLYESVKKQRNLFLVEKQKGLKMIYRLGEEKYIKWKANQRNAKLGSTTSKKGSGTKHIFTHPFHGTYELTIMDLVRNFKTLNLKNQGLYKLVKGEFVGGKYKGWSVL